MTTKRLYKMAFIALWTALVIALTALATGCTPTIETRYITQELHRDPPPLLPKVHGVEIQDCESAPVRKLRKDNPFTPCLAKDTAQKIFTREKLMGGYAHYLEAIIDSTKPTEAKK